jgi:hypothetical protein
MLESGLSGSVRGVPSNGHPYRDPGSGAAVRHNARMLQHCLSKQTLCQRDCEPLECQVDLMSQFSSSAEGRQIACLLMGLALFEIRDERAKSHVRTIEGHQFAGVPKRRRKIADVSRDRNQRREHVSVCGIALICLLQ